MTPDSTPEPRPSDPLAPEGAIAGNAISAPMVGVVALAIGLLGGYLLFGQKPAATNTPLVSNTANQTYTPDVSGSPTRLGNVAVRELKTLDEWDPLDPFDGGFPMPPEDWIPPLLALNPPIPVAATVATSEGGTPTDIGGSGFASMPMPRIRGDVGSLPPMMPPNFETEVVPMNPGETTPGTGAPGELPQTNGAMLITGTLTGVNEKTAQATIAALGAKYGGASRSFTHMGVEGDVEAEGVLLLVAPSDALKAMADIKRLGNLIAEDRSEGSTGSRQSRLNGVFASRLAGLRKRREELLVQFLEDADPIKNIDSAIDREARALSAVRLTGAADRLTAIRILLKP